MDLELFYSTILPAFLSCFLFSSTPLTFLSLLWIQIFWEAKEMAPKLILLLLFGSKPPHGDWQPCNSNSRDPVPSSSLRRPMHIHKPMQANTRKINTWECPTLNYFPTVSCTSSCIGSVLCFHCWFTNLISRYINNIPDGRNLSK